MSFDNSVQGSTEPSPEQGNNMIDGGAFEGESPEGYLVDGEQTPYVDEYGRYKEVPSRHASHTLTAGRAPKMTPLANSLANAAPKGARMQQQQQQQQQQQPGDVQGYYTESSDEMSAASQERAQQIREYLYSQPRTPLRQAQLHRKQQNSARRPGNQHGPTQVKLNAFSLCFLTITQLV